MTGMPRIKITARKHAPAGGRRPPNTPPNKTRGRPPRAPPSAPPEAPPPPSACVVRPRGKTKPRVRPEKARARVHAASKRLRWRSRTPCRHLVECTHALSRGRRALPAPGSGNAASQRNRTAYNRCTIDGFHNHRLVISLRRYLSRKLPDPYGTDREQVNDHIYLRGQASVRSHSHRDLVDCLRRTAQRQFPMDRLPGSLGRPPSSPPPSAPPESTERQSCRWLPPSPRFGFHPSAPGIQPARHVKDQGATGGSRRRQRYRWSRR